MQGNILQRKGIDTLVHGTGVLVKKGHDLCLFKNKNGGQGKARKTKEFYWVSAAGRKTCTDFSGGSS